MKTGNNGGGTMTMLSSISSWERITLLSIQLSSLQLRLELSSLGP
jgi:hypothetical protein